MDGVLVDNAHYHVQAWLEFARTHGGSLTERQVIEWMGAPARDYVRRIFGRPDMSDAEAEPYAAEKETLYREIFRPHLKAPEGLVRLLDYARARGIVCAVATGGSRTNVDFVLNGLGLRDRFAAVVDASGYSRGKPAPDCYLRAAEAVGVAPSEALVFEDAVNGIQAAHSAGMRVVAITGTNPRDVLVSAGAEFVIDSFSELRFP